MAHTDRMPTAFQRVENALVAVLVVIAFLHLDFAWWWLVALFLVFDVSAVGYIGGPRLGAVTYNAVHNYTVPAVLIGIALLADARWAAFVGLAWAFHVAADRALGYGLKFADRFTHTHLGDIGDARRAGPAGADRDHGRQ